MNDSEPNILGREPVMVMWFIQSLIAAAVGFGLNWTGAQVTLVIILASAGLSLVARQRVSPVSSQPD